MKRFLAGILTLCLMAAFRCGAQLTLSDVEQIIAQAATRAALISPGSVIAIVNAEGFVLGVWDTAGDGVTPPPDSVIALAVSKAGTGAFLSSNQNAFTSRTAGFITQQHFPPGVANRPPGPLVGVGLSQLPFSNANRFKGPGSVPGTLGVPVPGTSLNASPGGLPLYKDGILVGGIGVTGDGTEGYRSGPDRDEQVALAGQVGFGPSRQIFATRVFIDGLSLPYALGKARLGAVAPLGSIGAAVPAYPLMASPPPVVYPTLVVGAVAAEIRNPIVGDPLPGTIRGEARLTAAEVTTLLEQAVDRAHRTRAGIRLPRGQSAQVWISVINNPDAGGATPDILGTVRTPGATMFSWDLAVQKAYTALFFSSDARAFSSRTVGFLAQSHYPPGIIRTPPGPFFGLQEKFSTEVTPGVPPDPALPNGMTIFPGGFPLYRNGVLIGAIGVSGDGVDQDDLVGAAGSAGFTAPPAIRADQFTYHGARLPYAKFPRNPTLF